MSTFYTEKKIYEAYQMHLLLVMTIFSKVPFFFFGLLYIDIEYWIPEKKDYRVSPSDNKKKNDWSRKS